MILIGPQFVILAIVFITHLLSILATYDCYLSFQSCRNDSER